MLVALGVAACTVENDDDFNDKNTCEQACDKIETCPSQQCTSNFEDCDAQTEAVAECVLDTPCERMSTCLP